MSATPVTPAKPPEGITSAELARYARLTEGIKALKGEQEILNKKIKLAYQDAGVTGKHNFVYPAAGGVTVIVALSESFSIDLDTLAEDYPLDKKPEYWTSTIDPKKIPADKVEKYRTIPTPKLAITKA